MHLATATEMAKDSHPPAPELISVKVWATVYRKIRTVAAWKGVNIADYLSQSMLPIVDRDFEKMKQESEEDD